MPLENKNAVFVRELKIDDIAPVFHLGEQLFTSDLYPYKKDAENSEVLTRR